MIEVVAGAVVAYIIAGVLLGRAYLLVQPPPASVLPREGAVIRSDAEGFTQRILVIRGDRMWSRVTLDPGAFGPPAHVHARFAERFHVASGRVQLDLADGTKQLGEGEEHLVSAGVRHQGRNPFDQPAVVEGPLSPEYALPKAFALFRAQAYAFFDESPGNARLPRAILQMCFWSPWFDVWLPGPPIAAQRLLFVRVRPVAFLLGFRPWYARFAAEGSIRQ